MSDYYYFKVNFSGNFPRPDPQTARDANIRVQSGLLPVILATPIPKSYEYTGFANYLRLLSHAGLIDLRIPKLDQEIKLYPVSSVLRTFDNPSDPSTFYDADFFGVEPTHSPDLDSFFKTLDSEFRSRDRRAVVVFGCATDKKKIILVDSQLTMAPTNHVDMHLSLDIASEIDQIQGSGVLPIFPKIPDELLSIGVQVQYRPKDITFWDQVFDTEQLVSALVASIPEVPKTKISKKNAEPFYGRVFRDGEHFRVWVGSNGPREEISLTDLTSRISKGLENIKYGHERFQYENPLPWDVNYPEVFARTPSDLIVAFAGGVSRIRYPRLPELSTFEDLDIELGLAKRHEEVLNGIKRDAKFRERIHEISKVINDEMSKVGMKLVRSFLGNKGHDPIDSMMWDLTAIADASWKKIKAIKSQYGTIDNPQIPFDDLLRLASAVGVHRRATEIIENTRCVMRGEESFHRTIKALEKINPDFARGIVPIPDEAAARLVVNIATQANAGTDQHRELLDQVDSILGCGIRELIDVAEGTVARSVGERDLMELDAEPSASTRAQDLPIANARMTASTTQQIIRRELDRKTKPAQTDSGPIEPRGF